MNRFKESTAYSVFMSLIKGLTSSELKKFISDYAIKNDSFAHQFIIAFIESSAIEPAKKYEYLASSIVQYAETDRQYNGTTTMNSLTQKAIMMVAGKDFLDAFHIASAIVASELINNEKLVSKYEPALKDSFEILKSVMLSDAGFELKEKVFGFLTAVVPAYSKNYSIGLRQVWLKSTLEGAADETDLSKFLFMLATLKESNRDQFGRPLDESEEEQILIFKMQVLEKLGKKHEVAQLIGANLSMKYFRLLLIRELIAEKKLNEARQLIKAGKQSDARRGRMHVSTDWDLLLLQIAQEERDKKTIRNIALQLFLNTDFNFEYYWLLKEQYIPAAWKKFQERLIALIRKEPDFYNKGRHAVAQIYVHEQEWEKLLMLLQKNAELDFIEKYGTSLQELFPERLMEVYRRAIRRFAEKYMGAEAYRRIIAAIYTMLAMRNGKQVVQSLLVELKVDYRNRKKFIDELRNVVI